MIHVCATSRVFFSILWFVLSIVIELQKSYSKGSSNEKTRFFTVDNDKHKFYVTAETTLRIQVVVSFLMLLHRERKLSVRISKEISKNKKTHFSL